MLYIEKPKLLNVIEGPSALNGSFTARPTAALIFKLSGESVYRFDDFSLRLSRGEALHYRKFDCHTMTLGEETYIQPENLVIIEGAYSRAGFNKYGDIDYPRNHNLVDFSSITLGVPSVTDEGIALINEMNAFCQERGATCLLAAYPIPYGEYSPAEESFWEMSEVLKTNIDCELISDYTDYFFDYEYFYDSQYHLTTEGTDLRTKQLIKDLQNWMEP